MTAAPMIMLPKPEIVVPGFTELPEPIQAVIERLSTPFPIEEVKVRPGAVRRDGTAALCLAYSDWWTGYLPRLNDEIGPNNWSIVLRPWGEHQIIARLRAFGGLIEKESSGSAKGEANGAQEAEVQAKKRACAEGLMLGLYLDGELVASGYFSEVAARMELDLAAWYVLFGEAQLVSEIPITEEALDLALAVFNRLFTIAKIQEKGRLALEKIIRTEIYTIAADGSLRVLASSGRGRQASYTVMAHRSLCDDTADSLMGSYHVTMTCGCKDFYARAHEHGGVCKHVAARLLLFLAQRGVAALKHLQGALDSEETLPPSIVSTAAPADEPLAADEDGMAFVTLAAAELAAALFLALRGTAPVELRAERGTLHLLGDVTDLKLRCLDGSGTAAVSLEADVMSTLYDHLRPAARSAGAITLFVETTSGSVCLCSQDETFSAEAMGVPIAALTTPLTA